MSAKIHDGIFRFTGGLTGRARALLAVPLILLAAPALRAQTLWVGGNSADWFSAGNWNSAVVPAGGNNVVVNTNGTFQPVITGQAAVTNDLYVGNDSSSGVNTLLTIQAGGNLVTSGNAFIGFTVNGTGVVTVGGANSTWSQATGNLTIGENGTGTLTIGNGGNVSSHNVSIGDQAGANGIVTVNGANARWTVASGFTIGNGGVGVVFVLNGGIVSAPGFVTVGNANGSHGTVTVDGASSKMNLGGDLFVGFGAGSFLTVSNGGNVTSSGGELGILQGNALATVTDPNSTWNLGTGSLLVGEKTAATLTIANGGNVTSTGGTLGVLAGGNGTVDVTDAGSVWNTGANASLVVGKQSAANLTIENGGLVITHDVNLSSTGGPGQLNLNSGGILQVGGSSGLHAGSANYTINFGGGVLRVSGADFTTSLDATLAAGTSSTIDTNGFNATWAGTLSGTGSLIKVGNGTLNLNGGDTYSGNTHITGGKLIVGGNIIVPSGVTLEVDGNLVASQVTVSAGGTVSGNGTITGNLVNNGNVTLGSGPGQHLTVVGNLTNNGLVSLLNGSSVVVSGSTLNNVGAILDGTTGSTPSFGSFSNSGLYIPAGDAQVATVAASGTDFVVTIQSYPNHNYELQGCTNLTTANWTAVVAPAAGTGGILTLTHVNGLQTAPLLFYRVLVSP